MKTIFNNNKNLEIRKEVRGTVPFIQVCYFCRNPITRLTGRDADSLLTHHVTYIPEVKVLVHRGCHTKYHKTHPNHPTNPDTEYRKRFTESSEDMVCFFCDEPITKMYGLGPDSLLIHSLDGNHENWDSENKVPTHRGCHQRFHIAGDRNPSKRPEVAAKISKTRTGSKTGKKAWRTRRDLYGPSGLPEDTLERLSSLMKGDGNPMRNPESVAKMSRTKIGKHNPHQREDLEG